MTSRQPGANSRPHPEMVPFAGIGPATSPLPRECSTTEPKGLFQPIRNQNAFLRRSGSLERETGIEPASSAWKAGVLPLNYSRIGGTSSTPNATFRQIPNALEIHFIAGGEGWIRTSVLVRGQIYSLLPLTTRPPLRRTSEYSTVERGRRPPQPGFCTAAVPWLGRHTPACPK